MITRQRQSINGGLGLSFYPEDKISRNKKGSRSRLLLIEIN